MSAPRVAILVGILALAGGGAYLVVRGDNSAGSHVTAPAPPTASAPQGNAAIAAPAGPTLAAGTAAAPPSPPPPAPSAPPTPPVPAGPAPAEAFAAQKRDPSWAGATESELRKRIPAIGSARLTATECRHDSCLLTFDGTQADLADMLARLESPSKGLASGGFARSIVLTAPAQQGDKLVLRAYAQFTR